MPRIRTVKPEFFKHEELFEAEKKHKLPLRIAFVGLWCVSDREGRFKWKPNVIKLDVLPYDNCDFSKVLDTLNKEGFIIKYEINGNLYGYIPTFLTHQVINNRESASSIPEPKEEHLINPRVTHASPTPLRPAQGEGKGKEEEQGKEEEGALFFLGGLVYPFESENFVAAWKFWIDYKKKQHKFQYADLQYEQAALKELSELSNNNEKEAILIIQKSISSGWKGFFELKENKNGNKQQQTNSGSKSGLNQPSKDRLARDMEEYYRQVNGQSNSSD